MSIIKSSKQHFLDIYTFLCNNRIAVIIEMGIFERENILERENIITSPMSWTRWVSFGRRGNTRQTSSCKQRAILPGKVKMMIWHKFQVRTWYSGKYARIYMTWLSQMKTLADLTIDNIVK